MNDLDAAIDAWVRTVKGRVVWHPNHAGSIEGQYRRTSAEWLEAGEPPPEKLPPIDYRLGWAVEYAWRKMENRRWKKLLSAHYIRNRSLEDAARIAKIHRYRAAQEMRHARHKLSQLLAITQRLT